MGEGVLYNFIFTEYSELSFKTVSGDVTGFHRITVSQ